MKTQHKLAVVGHNTQVNGGHSTQVNGGYNMQVNGGYNTQVNGGQNTQVNGDMGTLEVSFSFVILDTIAAVKSGYM